MHHDDMPLVLILDWNLCLALQEHVCPLQQSGAGAQADAAKSDCANMPNGSHHEVDDASDEPEQVDEVTAAKQQVLVKAAPLAGVWGLERFGLAHVTVLRILEALPGELAQGRLLSDARTAMVVSHDCLDGLLHASCIQ